ncbi:MAG: hypothetical protein R6U00_02340, partial [Prochlorococcaceae cyanobacterium]
PAPGRDLPAPYQNPWMLLGRDLRALLATARLRGWELARRNRQGDLAVPAFWPRELRPWFWPLVLSLVLALLVGLLVLVGPLLPGRLPQGQQPQQALREDQPAAPLPAAPEPMEQPPPAAEPAEPPEPLLPPEAPPDLPPAVPAGEPPAAAPLTEAPPIDPLLALLHPADPGGLILAVRERPASSCLQLELAAGFAALAPERQGQQAEAWRGRALELGYERLELVDGAGRLLGRTARVGSGMILLTSAAPAPDAP